jgi:hypothetical protein
MLFLSVESLASLQLHQGRTGRLAERVLVHPYATSSREEEKRYRKEIERKAVFLLWR